MQYRFIQQIIDYMTKDGFIHPSALYESPFTDIHHGDPDEVFGDHTDDIFGLIEGVNNNALECVG